MVRRATAADAADLGRLLDDFNSEFGEYTPGPEALAERLASLISAGEAAALLAGDGPDGIAVYRLRRPIFTEGLDAYLEELYVAPAKRGRGLGRALLEATMEAARADGATRMELGTEETDTAAIALYESEGFTNRDKDGAVSFFYEREL